MLYNILKQCSSSEAEDIEDLQIPNEVKDMLMKKPEAELEKD